MGIKIVVKTINLEMLSVLPSKDSIPLTKARLLNVPLNFPAFQLFFYDWESEEKTGLSVEGNNALWEFSISGTAQLCVELSETVYSCVCNVLYLGVRRHTNRLY
jgi:hypothetical protein